MTRALISLLGGAALCFSSLTCAMAAPLAPGGSAGVKQAETWERIPVWGYVGGVLVIVGFVLVLTDNGNGHAAPTTCFTPSGLDSGNCSPSPPTTSTNTTGTTGTTGTN